MGTDIDTGEFDERDYSRFPKSLGNACPRLGSCLTAWLRRRPRHCRCRARAVPRRRRGPAAAINQAIRAAVADPRITVEIDRFNLELNASPAPLAGRPFATLGSELNVLLDQVAKRPADHAGRVALIGILPTLTQADLGPGAITDVPRYRALMLACGGSASARSGSGSRAPIRSS